MVTGLGLDTLKTSEVIGGHQMATPRMVMDLTVINKMVTFRTVRRDSLFQDISKVKDRCIKLNRSPTG